MSRSPRPSCFWGAPPFKRRTPAKLLNSLTFPLLASRRPCSAHASGRRTGGERPRKEPTSFRAALREVLHDTRDRDPFMH